MGEVSSFEERDALLDAWATCRREIDRMEARAAELLARRQVLFDADVAEHQLARDSIRRSMIAEFSAAGRLAKGTVESAFAAARALTEHHSAVLDALRQGRITVGHARQITQAAAAIDEAVLGGTVDRAMTGLFDAAVLAFAEQDSPARTGVHARQVVAALLGEDLRERHTRARAERCVQIVSIEDGLARLTAVLPEHIAFAIRDRLDQLVREVARAEKAGAANSEVAGDDGPSSASPNTGATIGDIDTGGGGDVDDPEDTGGADRLPDDPDSIEEFLARVEAFLAAESESEGDADDSHRASRVGRPFFGHPDDEWFPADPEPADNVAARMDAFLADLNGTDDRLRAGERTLDQIRADLFTDLLLGADPTVLAGTGLDGVTARIQVTVAATTLTGADDRMAQIDGIGPVHPDIARELAGRSSGWARLFLDPTGMTVETDAYTPTDGMRRFLRARDQHCRFPGCRRPAASCEIDHNHDHALGGATAIDNLAHFCPAHHQLKHPSVPDRFRWTAHLDPDSGGVVWTAPDGREYTDAAPRRVMFV
ncbi:MULTISPECIES: HNH endonuclease signature motif containing protein [unclassified Microbacterium]|uniref:HNH endonuclease signature motif containing protein n=1 Tax=unclassified Microbacterium TaxID=2609290 RepID=UPI0012FCBA0A|nr:HNH endonuclease signature motif containing protein [Microbacterium sp. MAH-37]MVQ42805.1 DUF222 domain-containing protein [Microbacterium sp. MAH-37]